MNKFSNLIILLLAITIFIPCADTYAADKITLSLYEQIHRTHINDGKYIRVWIHFDNKNTREYVKLSSRAFQRLRKMNSDGFHNEDLLVDSSYVRFLEENGIRIKYVSNWLNAVSSDLTINQIYGLESLPFIKKLDNVKKFKSFYPDTGKLFSKSMNSRQFYEASINQLKKMNIPLLHELGFSGKDTLICLLDSGFNTEHESLQEENIIGQYDFVNRDYIVKDEAGDPYGAHNHGTATLSIIGAYKQGKFAGGAPESRFILGKTVDITSVVSISEDAWVAGVEWADSLGADIIGCSLGVMTWDDGSICEIEELRASGSVISKIAETAVRRGILIISDIGNNGHGENGLSIAAETDYILTVGALGNNGLPADFSAEGPSINSEVKPDLIAPGVGNVAAGGQNYFYESFSGTSYAAPLVIAGASLLLQAHPEWSPSQVQEAIKKTSSYAATPENGYGYGLPDFYAAINYTPPAPSTGDINDDGIVDGDDLSLFGTQFGFKCGDKGFNKVADMDNNCVVDGNDLVILSIKFEK